MPKPTPRQEFQRSATGRNLSPYLNEVPPRRGNALTTAVLLLPAAGAFWWAVWHVLSPLL